VSRKLVSFDSVIRHNNIAYAAGTAYAKIDNIIDTVLHLYILHPSFLYGSHFALPLLLYIITYLGCFCNIFITNYRR